LRDDFLAFLPRVRLLRTEGFLLKDEREVFLPRRDFFLNDLLITLALKQ